VLFEYAVVGESSAVDLDFDDSERAAGLGIGVDGEGSDRLLSLRRILGVVGGVGVIVVDVVDASSSGDIRSGSCTQFVIGSYPARLIFEDMLSIFCAGRYSCSI
jgi:hypothetical protein